LTLALLATKKLGVNYGGFNALSDVELTVAPNTIHSVVGPNGAGKTTLFQALTGRIKPSSGQIMFNGDDITSLTGDRRVRLGLARSFQVTSLFHSLSARENLRLAAQGRFPWRALKIWQGAESNEQALAIADDTLAKVDLADVAARPAEELSHGEQRRLEVGMAIASCPRLILLDEPTSGMGIDDIGAMKKLIADLGRDHTVLLIEHNMEIVMNLSDRVTVMQSGRILVEGTPSEIRDNEDVRRAYLGSMITGGRA
jgi:branched-chain amino acid transport system ATP-binding protein